MQQNRTPKATRERRKPKVDRKEEVIKIRAEINEIEMKKTSMKLKVLEELNKTFGQTYQDKKRKWLKSIQL